MSEFLLGIIASGLCTAAYYRVRYHLVDMAAWENELLQVEK